MKKFLIALALILIPLSGNSQSAQRYYTALLPNTQGENYVAVIPNASVYVCTYNVEKQCITPAPIYYDTALTQPVTQPLLADGSGVYSYYIQSGSQVVEKVCAPYDQCSSYIVQIGDNVAEVPGSGTVTSVSCGNLTPLFSCLVSNATTTPALGFTLDTAQSFGVLGNFQSSTANPQYYTLVAGSNVTLTANNSVSPPTVTVASSGGGVAVAATSPILVNGGAGPVSSGTATISCPSCGSGSGTTTNFQLNDVPLTGLFPPNAGVQVWDANSTLPAAPTATLGQNTLCTWQADPTTGRINCYVPNGASTLVNGPGTGNHIFLPFTVATPYQSSGGASSVVYTDTTATITVFANSSGFPPSVNDVAYTVPAPLPATLTPADVTAVYAVVWQGNSFGGANVYTTCNGSTVTAAGSGVNPFYILLGTSSSVISGSNCTFNAGGSGPRTQLIGYLNLVGLEVYYNSGSPAPPPQTAVQVEYPLDIDPTTGAIGISPLYPNYLNPVSIASLPLPQNAVGQQWVIGDGTTNTDCFTGGGSYTVVCLSQGYNGGWTPVSQNGLSGMTIGQIPVAASATTVTSSKALAGAGAGITTGPTSSTNLDCVNFSGTTGQIQDSGSPCGSGSGSGLSGMTAGQVPIAATATTVTSSKTLAGSGAGITTGPTTSVNSDCVKFTGTTGQISDSGSPCGSSSLTLTTVGGGGPATYSGGTLNIPVYAGITQPYPVVVNSGDSDGVYSPTAPQTSPSSASGCNGTVCTINATNTHVAGDWVTFNNQGGTWGCLAWAPAQVLSTGLTGSSFEVSEAQAMIPTYAGCTGVVSGLGVGSLIQDSNDLYGQLVVHYPTLSAQGTAVPTLYPYSIPGNTATADASNFTARYGAVAPSTPHGALFINNDGANDFNNCESVSTIETALQSVWTQAHAANYDVLDATPIGGFTAFNAGGLCSQNTTLNYDTVMQWLYAQKCVDGNGTACWDYLADSGGTIKDFSNPNMISSGHPTPAANTIYAAVIDRALSSKMVTYNYNPGAGANVLHGTQLVLVPPTSGATTMEAWSFTADNPSLSICEYGTAMWMSYVNTSVVSTYCPNWLTFNYSGTQGFVTVDPNLTFGFGDSPNCLVCFSLDPSANGPYGLNDTMDLGANVYPSSSAQLHDTTAWLGNGGLKLHNWTSDPSVLTNGQVWFNSTSGQLKGYFAGTTFCISGTGCSSGAAFPSTNGIVFNTSTTASRNATASDLASLTYVADSGTTNAYAAVLPYPISSYTAGLTVTINPGSTNTSTTPTLSVSGLSAITIVKPVSGSLVALTASDIVSGTLAAFKYDGTHFQLQNPQTTAAAGVSSVNATAPLTANGVSGSAQTGTVVVACPTCSVGSGTSVSLPGASSLGSVTFNGNVGLLCADTSGSGTAQSCTTTPSITPATGTCFTYITTTTNSGTALTLNMDSFGAKSVAVASSSGWTTTLTASTSISANKPMLMCYDGTNLNASGTGYTPSGGSSYPTPETHTASSSAELDFTSCFSSSYKNYVIKATNMQVATNGAVLLLQFGNSGTYDSSSIYSWAQPNTLLGGSGGLNQVSNGNGIAISLAASNTSGLASSAVPGNSWTLNVNDPLSTTAYKTVTGEGMGNYVGSGVYFYYLGGYYANNASQSQFRIIPSTGNIASGQVTCQPQPQ